MMYAVGGESCLYLLEQAPDAVEVLQLPEAGGDAKSLAQLPGDSYYKLIGCRDGLFISMSSAMIRTKPTQREIWAAPRTHWQLWM